MGPATRSVNQPAHCGCYEGGRSASIPKQKVRKKAKEVALAKLKGIESLSQTKSKKKTAESPTEGVPKKKLLASAYRPQREAVQSSYFFRF